MRGWTRGQGAGAGDKGETRQTRWMTSGTESGSEGGSGAMRVRCENARMSTGESVRECARGVQHGSGVKRASGVQCESATSLTGLTGVNSVNRVCASLNGRHVPEKQDEIDGRSFQGCGL